MLLLLIIWHRTIRFIRRFMRLSIGLLIFFIILSYFNFFQNFLAGHLTKWLSQKTGMTVSIDRVSINWLNRISLFHTHIVDEDGVKMLDAESVQVRYSLFKLLFNKDILLKSVILKNTNINLYQSTKGINLLRFADSISTENASANEPSFFSISSVKLQNVHFSWVSEGASVVEQGQFDPNRIVIDSLYGDFFGLWIRNDTVKMDIVKLKGREYHTGLTIKNLSTRFLICKNSLQMDDLDLEFGSSRIRDRIRFGYKAYSDLSDFFQNVNLDCHLSNTILLLSDLSPFSSTLNKFPIRLEISGTVEGQTNNFTSNDFSLCFGKNSHLSGDIELRNLPNPDDAIFIFSFKNSQILASDLIPYLPESASPYLSRLGMMNFTSEFYGTISDFTTDGVFDTNLGKIRAFFDLHKSYQGTVSLESFDVGTLLNNSILGRVDLNADIEGSGFELNHKDSIDVTANISGIQLFGYRYKNTFADFKFGRKNFNGFISVADTNLRLNFEGKINLSDSTFRFRTEIDTFKLKPVNISPLDITTALKINADFKGLDLDKIEGYVNCQNIKSSYENRLFSLKEFYIGITELKAGNKRFLINSDIIRARVEGNNSFRATIEDILRLFNSSQKYFIGVVPDSISKPLIQYKYDYTITLVDPDRISKFINYPLRISKKSSIRGTFEVDSTINFTLSAKSDSVSFGKNRLYKANLNLSLDYNPVASGAPYNFELLFLPERISLNNISLDQMQISSFNVEKELMFYGRIRHAVTKDNIGINTGVRIENDSIVVVFGRDTYFELFDDHWYSEGQNRLIYDIGENSVFFDNVLFGSQGQKLGIDGKISTNPNDKFSIFIEDFDLNVLTPYTGVRWQGRANLEATIKDVFGKLFFTFKGHAKEIKLQDFLLGDLTAKSLWDDETEHLETEFYLRQADQELIKLVGFLDFSEKSDNFFNLNLFLDNAPIGILEPFVKDYINIISGFSFGNVVMKGNFDHPKIKGGIFINEGKFRILYSNVVYSINDRISFDESKIKFKNFRFKDDLGNSSRLDGEITHEYFEDIKLNLNFKLLNLKVFSTKPSPNSMFYGTVFMSGEAAITGPVGHPNLNLNLITERGTKLFMPLETTTDVELQQDFIRFVKRDTLLNEDVSEKHDKVSYVGFEMNLNLEIGSGTYAEIIVNKKNGDLIEVYGKGKLSIAINSNDELEMYGKVEVESGRYRLSFINLVKKEFDIRSPSSLSWSGDPMSADLDIIAVYRQNISLAPILEGADSTILRSPEIQRRYPVETKLFLKGNMFQPSVSYDVSILDYPSVVMASGVPFSVDAQVAAFKQAIKNNEQELNRQVFSLLVLKSFSARNTFSGGNFAGGSVGELLANQLSYWISQVDDNLEIDVDLQGLTQEALRSARIRLSYTALGGRIRITREGGVSNQQGTQSNVSSVVGDWVVEYMIKHDGSLRLKMYHKQNVSAFTNVISGSRTTTGISFMHTKSFDIGKRRRRNNKKSR